MLLVFEIDLNERRNRTILTMIIVFIRTLKPFPNLKKLHEK